MYTGTDEQKRIGRMRAAERRKDPKYIQYMKGYMKKYTVKYNRLKKYGLTEEQHIKMLQAQNGVCKICCEPPNGTWQNGSKKELVVDHDHVTGEVRGLLCDPCNVGIDKLRENTQILAKAIEYLNDSRK